MTFKSKHHVQHKHDFLNSPTPWVELIYIRHFLAAQNLIFEIFGRKYVIFDLRKPKSFSNIDFFGDFLGKLEVLEVFGSTKLV